MDRCTFWKSFSHINTFSPIKWWAKYGKKKKFPLEIKIGKLKRRYLNFVNNKINKEKIKIKLIIRKKKFIK